MIIVKTSTVFLDLLQVTQSDVFFFFFFFIYSSRTPITRTWTRITQWIFLILIRWIMIHPVDSVIQRLNNRRKFYRAPLRNWKAYVSWNRLQGRSSTLQHKLRKSVRKSYSWASRPPFFLTLLSEVIFKCARLRCDCDVNIHYSRANFFSLQSPRGFKDHVSKAGCVDKNRCYMTNIQTSPVWCLFNCGAGGTYARSLSFAFHGNRERGVKEKRQKEKKERQHPFSSLQSLKS